MTRLEFNDDRWLSILMNHVWYFGEEATQRVFPPDEPEVILARCLAQYSPEGYAYDKDNLLNLIRRLTGMGQKKAWGEFLDTLRPETREVA